MTRRADQLLAGFADGDAISQQAVILRDTFRAWGWASDIFADPRHASPSLAGQFKPLADYRAESGAVVLHHYSIGSPALDLFAASPARKILIYHNITPPEFFDGFDDRVAASLRSARASLRDIGGRVEAIWAVSRFNAGELAALGLRNVRVFPLLFAPPATLPDDPEVLKRFAKKLKTVLFVGRLAPNKNVEALIEAFGWYHKAIDPFSRLIVIGSERSCPRYFAMLRMLVGDLKLQNVGFEGFASPGGIQTYYRHADLFVTTSRHEGYCLPLLEAMHHGLPVLAPALGGIPEAMDGAGVLFDGLEPAQLATLMGRVLFEAPLRQEILASQLRRLDEVGRRDIAGELAALMKDFA